MPENVRRLGALVVAALLVVGALLWRSHRGDGGTTSDTTTAPAAPDIVCATELARVCQAVFGAGVKIEPAGTTAETLLKAAAAPDLWLTLDPWPTIVADRRQRALQDPLTVTTKVLASTRVGLVGPKDRLDLLQTHCTGQKLWACLGDVSGARWDTIGGKSEWQIVKPGFVRPDRSASGYAVFANAVVAELGKTSFSNADLERIQRWGRNLEVGVKTIEPNDDPLGQLQLGVLSHDLVGALEVDVASLKAGLQVIYPDPVANVQAIAVTSRGFTPPARLGERLQQAGWNVSAPTTSGLPEVHLADAVIEFWKTVKVS